MSKGKFALGTLFGAVIGGVAALLTAPKSGKETRADIVKKAEEIKKTTETKTGEALKKAEEVRGNVETQAKELRDRTENAVKGAKDGFNAPLKK